MSKTKSVASKAVAPRDRDEAGAYLCRMAQLAAKVETISADPLAESNRLASAAEAQAKPLQEEIAHLSAGLQLWAEANRPALTRDGATKTVELRGGKVWWRQRPPSVRVTGADAVIDHLQSAEGLTRFLRWRVEIDKEAMLREAEIAETIPGVRITRGVEDFVAEPATLELAPVA